VRTVSVNTVHWFDSFSSGKAITLISEVQSLGYIFVAASSTSRLYAYALQIFEQFSPKARTPIHWMPSSNHILSQNDHSRSFKVIRFGVNEEPLRGYFSTI